MDAWINSERQREIAHLYGDWGRCVGIIASNTRNDFEKKEAREELKNVFATLMLLGVQDSGMWLTFEKIGLDP